MAGASLVPSPVTATISPSYLSPETMTYLSAGLDLANTFKFCRTIFMFARFPIISTSLSFPIILTSYLSCLLTIPPTNSWNFSPSMQTCGFPSSSPSVIIPHSLAIAMAVMTLSPVTILTLTPATLHF